MRIVDVKKRCRIKGEGKPVLVAHGVGGPMTVEKLAEGLAAHFKVIVPTYPGYLAKDGLVKYSEQSYMDFTEQVREWLGYEEINLVGFSLGGHTAINYALQHPNRVTKLAFIGAGGLKRMYPLLPLKSFGPYLIKQALKNPKNGLRYAGDDFVDKDSEEFKKFAEHVTDMMKDEAMRSNIAQASVGAVLAGEDWKEKLPAFDKPTLILWADKDKTMPVSFAHEFHALIKNSNLSILEGYGHMAVLEKPEFFADEIGGFLKDLE